MVLHSVRFAGDPVLERCQDGSHRMLLNEEGLAVARVQAALQELGYSVGSAGIDGAFGLDTGVAVSQFKAREGLSPTDPVVGVGTMTKLDNYFFVDPPELDPAFREFAPFVAARRLEPFVAVALSNLLSAPLDSWRHMAGKFALERLSTNDLAGIVAGSRFGDLGGYVLEHGAAVQPDGSIVTDWFERERLGFVGPDGLPLAFGGSAVTFSFGGTEGGDIGIIVVSDKLIRGQSLMVIEATGQSVPVTLDEDLLIHELTHLRNAGRRAAILATWDRDPTVYVDPTLANALTVTGLLPTARVLHEFLEEMSARHVEWHLRQEREGNPIALNLLTPEQLAAAVVSYLSHFPTMFDAGNGYIHALAARPDAVAARLRQAALWLRQLEPFAFTDLPHDEAAVHERLLSAADYCEAQANAGASSDPLDPDGLTPLLRDFH